MLPVRFVDIKHGQKKTIFVLPFVQSGSEVLGAASHMRTACGAQGAGVRTPPVLVFPSNLQQLPLYSQFLLISKQIFAWKLHISNFKAVLSYKPPFSLLWGTVEPILQLMLLSSSLCLGGAATCFSANTL